MLRRECLRVIFFGGWKPKLKILSDHSSGKKKKREEREQMTETTMEEITISLLSRIREWLLLGADRETPANTELQTFSSWVPRQGSPEGMNDPVSLILSCIDHPAYCHGQALQMCSQEQEQVPCWWPPLCANNHSLAPSQGTSTNPADTLARWVTPSCLLLPHTCKTVSLLVTPGIWSGSHPAFLYLKDILLLIKRKWNLP